MKKILNWCSNDLFITAKSKKAVENLKKFKETAFTKDKYPDDDEEKDIYIDFENFVPYPEEVYEEEKERITIKNLRKKGKNGEANKLEILYKLKGYKEFDWYNWNIQMWGTKWNSHYTKEPIEKGNKLFYNFDTAWSPPLPVVLAMSQMFPNLYFKIKYYEQGMGFYGTFECKAGVVIKDIYKNNYHGGRGG